MNHPPVIVQYLPVALGTAEGKALSFHFRSRGTHRLKVRRSKKVFHANGDQKKAGVGEFPDSPVLSTGHFHCGAWVQSPSWGIKILQAMQLSQIRNKN